MPTAVQSKGTTTKVKPIIAGECFTKSMTFDLPIDLYTKSELKLKPKLAQFVAKEKIRNCSINYQMLSMNR